MTLMFGGISLSTGAPVLLAGSLLPLVGFLVYYYLRRKHFLVLRVVQAGSFSGAG